MSLHLRLVVEDRHGVLDRVTGLIRRNGLNISDISAGERGDGSSHINIRIKDKGADIHILGKALAQLECVQNWELCSDETHLVREMLLFSIHNKDYKEELFPGAQLIEQCGDLKFFSYIASASDIDILLNAKKELFCDYSRGGSQGVKKEGGGNK